MKYYKKGTLLFVYSSILHLYFLTFVEMKYTQIILETNFYIQIIFVLFS